MAQFMDNMVVTHIAGQFTLKQFPNGSCILGGGFKGRGDIDTGTKELDYEQLIANLKYQCEVVPHLKTANLLRSWAGFTGALEDGVPLLGPWPKNPNLIFAFAGGAGFTLGPAVGKAVAEIITASAVPERLAQYGPGRLSP
jgi:sarcosine oxidase subunit beta